MPLVAITGSATANSFLTVADAIALLVGRPNAEPFTRAQRYLQEAWLIQATQLLALKVRWLGVRANPLALVAPIVQALPLPMVGQVDATGALLAEDVIPPLVELATALVALALAQEYGDRSPQRRGIQRVNVYQQVDITYTATGVTTSPRVHFSAEVWNLLRLYGVVPIMGRHIPVVRGQG